MHKAWPPAIAFNCKKKEKKAITREVPALKTADTTFYFSAIVQCSAQPDT